jgi:hypothetical protein
MQTGRLGRISRENPYLTIIKPGLTFDNVLRFDQLAAVILMAEDAAPRRGPKGLLYYLVRAHLPICNYLHRKK